MTRLGGFVICALFVGACAADGGPADNSGGNYSGSGSIGEGSNGSNGSGDIGDDGPGIGSNDGSDTGSGNTGSDTGSGDTGGGNGSGNNGGGNGSGTTVVGLTSPTSCAASNEPSTYWPYPKNAVTELGTPAQHPWWGLGANAPDGTLDFQGFAPSSTIECGSNKSQRSYLDVTAGCLDSASFQGATRGQIHQTSAQYYRSFALPVDEHDPNTMVKWTDQGGEYDFYFNGWTGNVSNPGFKVFARYLTEYDLYVASWREDGVVQIQKKQCGVYTILKRIPNYPPPAPGQWHHIRFEAVGTHLRLYTDGQLAVETTDDTFGAGTSGIRIDDAEGAYIDNWHVFAP